MHICHVISGLWGGPATSLTWLCAEQKRQGHRITLIYSLRFDPISCYDKLTTNVDDAREWQVRRQIGWHDWRAYRELKRMLADVQPDILYLHCSKAGAHGRIAATRLGIPAVFSPRGISYVRTENRLVRALHYGMEYALALTRHPIVACSPSEHKELERLPAPTHMIPNAVDLENLAGITYQGGPAGQFTIGILGSIKHQRMPDLVAKLAEQAPAHWHFVWIGDGPERHLVENRANIELVGRLPQREALQRLSRCDVALHAARWEGMPNALLEAMAIGMPCVVSDVVGARDLVGNRDLGLLVRNVSNPKEYVDILSELESDSHCSADYGNLAARQIRLIHGVSTNGVLWQNLYSMRADSQIAGTLTRPNTLSGSAS